MNNNDNEITPKELEQLMTDLNTIYDKLYKLLENVEVAVKESGMNLDPQYCLDYEFISLCYDDGHYEKILPISAALSLESARKHIAEIQKQELIEKERKQAECEAEQLAEYEKLKAKFEPST